MAFAGRRLVLASMAGGVVAARVAPAAEVELLLVGPGKPYPSLTAAGERLAKKWDPFARPANHDPVRIVISPAGPGYYDNDFDTMSRRWPTHNHGGWPPWHGILLGPAVIEGEPGKPAPELACTDGGDGVLYYQKGAFVTTDYDATFRHLHFSGFRRADGQGNYAAVRLDTLDGDKPRSGHFLFEDVKISGCDDGILGGSPGQTVTLRRCEFTENGGGGGRTHNIYVGPVDALIVEDTLSTKADTGHLLKSRAARTVVRRTRLLTGDATSSACLDVPDGGVLELEDVVCQKGDNSDASWLIHYGGENQDASGTPFHAESRIAIRNLTMVAPRRLASHPSWPVLGFANQSGAGEAASGRGSRLIAPVASEVSVWQLDAATAGLPATILSAAPALDWRSPLRG